MNKNLRRIVTFIYILVLLVACVFIEVFVIKDVVAYGKTLVSLDYIERIISDMSGKLINVEGALESHYSYTEKEVLRELSNKTYMDYTTITNKNSPQWDMIYNQKMFHITVDGYLLTDDGYYGVAMGTYFGGLGSKYLVILDTGKILPVCILDVKQDIHTDKNNFAGGADDIIEFVLDTSKMQDKIYANGYVWGGNLNNNPDFEGKVSRIVIIEEK